jgi:phytoene synthase
MASIPGYGGENLPGERPVRIERARAPQELSAVAAIVRRWDRDRYQTALFAPPERREALFALYAFNCEIARVRDRVREPALGRIRLEWWREAVAALYAGGLAPSHPVAEALATTIAVFAPAQAHFDRLIAARAADLDAAPPASLAALEAYAEGSSAPLVHLALEVLGARDPAAAATGRHVGISFALAGMLRTVPSAARAGRAVIPLDVARRFGLRPGEWRAGQDTPALRAAVAEIAGVADRHLATARARRRSVPRPALAALLPALVAGRVLNRLAQAHYNPFDPELERTDPRQSWHLAVAALLRRF